MSNPSIHSRKVTRVLVMLEYEAGDPDSGEVFDLTSLAEEIRAKRNEYSQSIHLRVSATKNFAKEEGAPPSNIEVSWSVNYSTSAAHLTDAINSGLPDDERVTRISTRVKRLRKQADKLEQDALVAKLEQVAAIRHQHPIARVTAPLAAIASPSA